MTQTPILNRKLELQERVLTPDGRGGFDVTWSTLGEVYAEIFVRRGIERLVGVRLVPTVSLTVIVRASPIGSSSRPKPEQRFIDGGRILSILAVSEQDRHGLYLEVWAEEVTNL